MIVASFVAAQRTEHGVPQAISCRALDVSESWFYKWRDRPPTPRPARRADIDAKVKGAFDASGGTYGSPRILDDLRDAGERVSKKTVERSMTRQGLVARPGPRRRHWLTRQVKGADPFPDLVHRDFSAEVINQKWSGDLTEIPTDEGKLYLAAVEDLASRRVPGFATGEHHDAELAAAAIKMAVAVRGGDVKGVIFHTDSFRGSEYTAGDFAKVCERFGINQSMGRVGSASYAGLAPVTRQSGKSINGESKSTRGNHRLKNAMFLAAFASLRAPESKACYDRKRTEGKHHNAALICLARRRCNVILAMLRTQQP
jgi:putative transposase